MATLQNANDGEKEQADKSAKLRRASLQIPDENPRPAMAGIYDPNDPLVQEWKEAMATYRKEVDNDPDYP